MNRIYRYALPLLGIGLLALSSCRMEQEELFDLSPSKRLEKATNDVREILTSKPNGWIMEYYYGGTSLVNGGTPIAMRFAPNGVVTISDVETIDTPRSSLYEIKADDNLSLDFVTYNANFHYYADPDENVGEGVGTGLEGDYEFVIESYSPEEIVLTGKKHYATIRLYPATGKPEEYLTKALAEAQKYLSIPAVYGVKGTVNGKEATGVLKSRQNITLTIGEESHDLVLLFTDKGAKLYKPVAFEDYTISDLFFDAETYSFSSSDGKVTLELERNKLGLMKEEFIGKYTISYWNGSSVVEKEVELIDNGSSSILLRGLLVGKDLSLIYDSGFGVIEIQSQALDNQKHFLASWNTSGPLDWNIKGLGMRSVWDGERDPFVLTFEHNGVDWVREGKLTPVNAFIIWDSGGGSDYTGYGDSRFMEIKLTKIQ